MTAPSIRQLTTWIEFFGMYWHLLDDERRKSYLLDMSDGKNPPSLEKLEELEGWQQTRMMKHMGETVRKYREKRKMDQKKLGEIMKKTPSHLSLIESGEKMFTAVDLARVMRILRIPAKELFLVGEQ